MPKKQIGRGLSASKPSGPYDTIIYNVIRYMNELNTILKKYGIKEELTIEKYATDANYINKLKNQLMKSSQNKIADQQDLIEFSTKLGLLELEIGKLSRKSQSQRGGGSSHEMVDKMVDEIKKTETYKNFTKNEDLMTNAKKYCDNKIKITELKDKITKELPNELAKLTDEYATIKKDNSSKTALSFRYKRYKILKKDTDDALIKYQVMQQTLGNVLFAYFFNTSKDDIRAIYDKYPLLNKLDEDKRRQFLMLVIHKSIVDLFEPASAQSQASVSAQPQASDEPKKSLFSMFKSKEPSASAQPQKDFIVGGKSKPRTRKPRTVKK